MQRITFRGLVAIGLRLVSVALLTGAVALTALEILVLVTVAPLDPERVVYS